MADDEIRGPGKLFEGEPPAPPGTKFTNVTGKAVLVRPQCANCKNPTAGPLAKLCKACLNPLNW